MKRLCFVTLNLCFAGVGFAQDSFDIEQSLPIGKKITYVSNLTESTSNGVPGEETIVEMKSSLSLTHSMSLTALDNGQKRAAVSLDAASIKTDMMEGGLSPLDLDTTSADDESPLTAVVGKEGILVFSSDDKIVSDEGLGEYAEIGDPVIQAIINQRFASDQIKILISHCLLQSVPEDSVSIGDSWPFKYEIPLQEEIGSTAIAGNYKLKEITDLAGVECLVIEVEGKIAEDLSNPGGVAAEMDITFEDTAYTGTIHFDNQIGLPRKVELKIEYVAKFKVTEGAEMLATTVQTFSNSLSKIDDQ